MSQTEYGFTLRILWLSPDATSVRRLCVVLSGSLWLRRGEELRSGERGCPAPPKLDEEKLRTFCYLYLSVFSVFPPAPLRVPYSRVVARRWGVSLALSVGATLYQQGMFPQAFLLDILIA